MNKTRFLASLVMLSALAGAGYAQTGARDCPNQFTYGVHARGPVNHGVEALIELTFFTTDDPEAFIPETDGLRRSTRLAFLDAGEFRARLGGLRAAGVARLQRRQSVTFRLGELAELGLERNSANVEGGMVNASSPAPGPGRDYEVERETYVSVSHDPRTDGDSYRVKTISWFVEATREQGGFKTVDNDSSILLKPGQTALIKLASDFEVRRSGPARKYMAVTLLSAGPAGPGEGAIARVPQKKTGTRGR